ncbi:MAG: cell division protein FtsQ/DivIB [Burkholderiaceae bacterium]|nr:cell division protein FtsQ/DivIB [Burkholderiaceae bacterium]
MWHDIKTMNALTGMLLGLCLMALLGAGLWWLAQRPMFTLRAIRVEAMSEGQVQGQPQAQLRHLDPAIVRGSALPHIRGNFFTANLDTVRQAFETVPWVRRATVRREWPNKLVVAVEEHVPLGTWTDDGRLLSVKGEAFTANMAEAEEDGPLPEFGGPDGSEKDVMTRYRDLNAWLAPLKLRPTSLQLSGRYAWSVKLDNGVSVELGREQSSSTLRERLDRLVAAYPQLLERLQNRIESIDLRYPNGLALKANGLALADDGKKKAGLPPSRQ